MLNRRGTNLLNRSAATNLALTIGRGRCVGDVDYIAYGNIERLVREEVARAIIEQAVLSTNGNNRSILNVEDTLGRSSVDVGNRRPLRLGVSLEIEVEGRYLARVEGLAIERIGALANLVAVVGDRWSDSRRPSHPRQPGRHPRLRSA